jgi:plastocyanin
MTNHTTVRTHPRLRLTLFLGIGVAILAVVAVLVGCSGGSTTTTAAGGTATTAGDGSTGGEIVHVKIQGMSLDPQTVTIYVGDTVTWTNLDEAPHNAV